MLDGIQAQLNETECKLANEKAENEQLKAKVKTHHKVLRFVFKKHPALK